MDNADLMARLAAAVIGSRALTIVTGAGVSAASGIATFRSGPGALWSRETMEKATLAFFRSEPVESWRWYAQRLAGLEAAEPNAAHRAIAGLHDLFERGDRRLRLITQNIDGLHRRAAPGQDIIEVHGAARMARCADSRCCTAHHGGLLPVASLDLPDFNSARDARDLPRCPHCESLLRPHVLWFDEYYDSHPAFRFDDLQRWAALGDLFLFVGTSFSVGVTDYLLREHVLGRCIPGFSIDPSGDDAGGLLTAVPAAAEDALPQLLARCTDLLD